MTPATFIAVRRYAAVQLRLARYLSAPGDGRRWPRIPAATLLWGMLAGYLLREGSCHAVEALVRSPARAAVGVPRGFGNDAVGYFTERLAPCDTRTALATAVRQAKRNKAFDGVLMIGLVLDGTTVAHCQNAACPLCHPVVGKADDHGHRPVLGYHHKLSLLTVVGGALVCPVDVEPYGPGESEHAASLRLLTRAVGQLGRRFADYVVADSLYASAPFLHAAGALGLHAIVRLKANVPVLLAAAQRRFEGQPPTDRFLDDHGDDIELWDAEDFEPWEDLRWPSVRVVRYRQQHRDRTVVEAYWLTDLSSRRISSRTLYRLAKGRWTIENQGFNDGKTRYGLDHLPHHHPNSLLIHWLLVALTLTLERLYRMRYLHRGQHPPETAIQFLRRLRLCLGAPVLESG